LSPLCRVSIHIFLRQTMSVGDTLLQLFCLCFLWRIYDQFLRWLFCSFTLALSEVCVQCPIWLFSVAPLRHGFLVFRSRIFRMIWKWSQSLQLLLVSPLLLLLLFNNPFKGKGFLSSPTRPVWSWSWSHPSPVQWILGFFLEVKRPGREVDSSVPSNDKVKNEWHCTFSGPVCLQGVGRETLYIFSFLTGMSRQCTLCSTKIKRPEISEVPNWKSRDVQLPS